jgi:hypothetical protein
MYTNVNLSAPVGALAFLGTAFLIFLAVILLIHSLIARKQGRAKVVIVAMLLVVGAYLGALLVLSVVSSEKVLARGEEKHFCEIDCHLAYSIVNTRQSQTLGNAPNQSTARGIYMVITIKTRFDETTIASRRGNGQLYPNSRVLTLFDEHGNKYSPSTEGQRALDASNSGSPLTTPLRPGESYTTAIAFDLPADVKTATLLINEGEWNTYFLIGHENSPLHKKTRFQL